MIRVRELGQLNTQAPVPASERLIASHFAQEKPGLIHFAGDPVSKHGIFRMQRLVKYESSATVRQVAGQTNGVLGVHRATVFPRTNERRDRAVINSV